MASLPSTLRENDSAVEDPSSEEDEGPPVPGLLLVFSSGQPRFTAFRLCGGELLVGRGDSSSVWPRDGRMSRQHARVIYDGQQFLVVDLGSQNGSFLDGQAAAPGLSSAHARVLRTGESLFLLCPDLRPYEAGRVEIREGRVVGPVLAAAQAQTARCAGFSATLHITGESGVGKEGMARHFHGAGPQAGGPFVAVNCATIPEGVAERVLFGARRGAFTGALADSEGLVQAADGGTLFLDEIAELDLAVQAKLLRVLETHEVSPLGATKPRAVKISFCSATNKDLRAEVGAGRFREDLFFRLSRPEVQIPPLRQRREEIPWLIHHVLQPIDRAPPPSAAFVEACLLRFWPGNIRELVTEVRAAGHFALAGEKRAVTPRHLSPTAGHAFVAEQPEEPAAVHTSGPSRELIEKVLKRTAGNVSAAARLLNMHRTQLKRVMDRLLIDPARFGNSTPENED